MNEKKYYLGEEIEKGKMEGIDAGIFTEQLLQNLRSSRRVSWVKIGGKCYYTRDDIETYIERNKVKTTI